MQVPGLAVVLVGTRKDSETYVRNKKKACEEVGIASFGETLPEEATEEQVLKASCFDETTWSSFNRLLCFILAPLIFCHINSCCARYA